MGYEPARVHELGRRTEEAIDALARIDSHDPAAADALRAVRLTRRNLEDHWMTALRAIERSDAMVSWRSLGRAHWRRPVGDSPLSDDPLSDDEVFGQLDWLERQRRGGHRPAAAELGALAVELAQRVARDAGFADRLLDRSTSTLVIAELVGLAEFPTPFVSRLVRAMMWPHGPTATADLDGFASALSSAMSSLIDQPADCLDLLLDPQVLHGIAAWERLDADVVAAFVTSGLYDAVAADPSRLDDGYEVLRTLTTLANGPLDGGIHPGVALGVASSLAGYVDTLAPAIRQEGATPVVVRSAGLHLELGTYDDLVDLFGAVLRDPAAQAALGTVLGGYTVGVVETLGAALTTRPGLQYVARFTDLIGDASRTEQAELVMAAAAEEARRRRLGGLIGFGVNTVLIASGVGSVARAITGRAIALATGWAARVDSDRLPDAQIPARTYDLITVATLTVLATDPTVRRQLGLGSIPAQRWSELSGRLAEIEREDDPHARTVRVGDLDHWIETEVPLLAAHLVEVRSIPGMEELTEGRNAVGTD